MFTNVIFVELQDKGDSRDFDYYVYSDNFKKLEEFFDYLVRKHNLYSRPQRTWIKPIMFKVTIDTLLNTFEIEEIDYEYHIKPLFEYRNKIDKIINMYNSINKSKF